MSQPSIELEEVHFELNDLWFTEFDQKDNRVQGRSTYKISEVLIVIFCGILCGLYPFEGIEDFAKERLSFFTQVFGMTRIPSDSTMSRIFSIIDAKAVVQEMIRIMKALFKQHDKALQDLSDEVIAVDGKMIRSTQKGEHSLQILTAYMTKASIIVGQEKIHTKTNEIPVFQQMLNYIDVKKRVVTADAMHCQKKTCQNIMKGNYVIGLKGNQHSLYEDVKLYFESEAQNSSKDLHNAFEIFEDEVEKSHGRMTKRTCFKMKNIKWLEQAKEWAGLKSLL